MNAAAAERAQERRELTEGAHALQVALGTEQADTLLALLDELSHWNRTYNLTALRTRAAMLHGHLLDSLSASPDLRGVRIADVGTGAGFPGLPLAVVTPQCAFTLIDSVGKKIRFVTHACRTLRVANVTALQARVAVAASASPVRYGDRARLRAAAAVARERPGTVWPGDAGGGDEGTGPATGAVRDAAWLAPGGQPGRYGSPACRGSDTFFDWCRTRQRLD